MDSFECVGLELPKYSHSEDYLGTSLHKRAPGMARQGFCLGATLMWFRAWLDKSGRTADGRIGYMQKNYSAIAGMQLLGESFGREMNESARTPEQVAQFFEGACRVSRLKFMPKFTFENPNDLAGQLKLITFLYPGFMYFIFLIPKETVVQGGLWCHVIGVAYHRNGNYSVFDANYGEFLIQSYRFLQFLRMYYGRIWEHRFSNQKFGSLMGFQVDRYAYPHRLPESA
ncbi:MAG: hypothetical protein GDA50_09170 [Alphaproteobacteria bacterium GM202ARS2]|nr:hypothetical protein [Alphaproteobacteria bacterium GM202ARS2]